MVTLGIEVFGESAIERSLLRFSERVVDASPAFEAIADMFYESEKRQFDTEGHWASGGWAPLAPSTRAAKREWQSTLRDTDALYNSLTGGEGSIKEIGPDSMFLGSDVPYGIFHQTGTGSMRGDPGLAPGGFATEVRPGPGPGGPTGPGMPMRKPVELPESVKRAMIRTLQGYIVTGVVHR